MEKFYTINETAEILSVHPNTIWRWIKEKKIESTKLVSGNTRISESNLKKFVGIEGGEDNGK